MVKPPSSSNLAVEINLQHPRVVFLNSFVQQLTDFLKDVAVQSSAAMLPSAENLHLKGRSTSSFSVSTKVSERLTEKNRLLLGVSHHGTEIVSGSSSHDALCDPVPNFLQIVFTESEIVIPRSSAMANEGLRLTTETFCVKNNFRSSDLREREVELAVVSLSNLAGTVYRPEKTAGILSSSNFLRMEHADVTVALDQGHERDGTETAANR